MPIDTILFDHDDTLVSTFAVRAKAWGIAVRQVLGIDVDGGAQLAAAMGETIERTALRLTSGDEPLSARLVQAYRDVYFPLSDIEIAPYPGVTETLATLHRRGVPMALVTSKIHAGAVRELRRCGLDGYLTVVVGSDDVTAHKPDPEPVLTALKLLGVEPARALMLGDTTADLLAARAAGTHAAAALWGAQDARSLRALAPTYTLEQIEDLLAIVDGVPPGV
ncbi:MAG: HAD-IA family hydrolase [Chloroflexi bacterium]|nr:HAD-IA family hydrolase [Chloroflexota bacterium]